MWGHRAILANCALSITSLTISSTDYLVSQLPAFPLPSLSQNILRGLIFPRLTHFQFECKHEHTFLLGDIMNWLTEDKIINFIDCYLQFLRYRGHKMSRN
ncbi:hypothetical protein LENED_009269 [Lentinula edodes]|uniref:Uncharacterized protein n=1 Tax=Lentinula edodes TaxID=5353 RepID=A0A1Q3EJB3_LENED|nr:hypothetical protein LENED_009269 [Lentinula edodes]